ncbi:MAG: NADH-quinone oxidoreductase subunit H [Thiohalomonadales bacterium]
MTTLLIVFLLSLGAYSVAVLEAWISTGRFRTSAPLYAAVAMLGRESIIARKPDRLFFEVGPVLLLLSGLLAAAVIPLAPDLIITDLATGALFINAALVYVLVALLMAGWGPDGAYAMIGGWRFLGQLIAYAMLIVMPLTAVAMRAESLLTTQIVISQAPLWNIVYQPLGFALFFLASMALAFLPPFDMMMAKGELAGGVEAEYTGVRLAVFRFARLVLIITLAAATVVFYLGGWLGPWLPPWLWSVIKILLVTAGMLLLGRYMPRIREAHLLSWCWKFGVPLALINILVVGILVLEFP